MADQPSTITPTWPTCDANDCTGIRMQNEQCDRARR
jgi:hypothetical protein